MANQTDKEAYAIHGTNPQVGALLCQRPAAQSRPNWRPSPLQHAIGALPWLVARSDGVCQLLNAAAAARRPLPPAAVRRRDLSSLLPLLTPGCRTWWSTSRGSASTTACTGSKSALGCRRSAWSTRRWS